MSCTLATRSDGSPRASEITGGLSSRVAWKASSSNGLRVWLTAKGLSVSEHLRYVGAHLIGPSKRCSNTPQTARVGDAGDKLCRGAPRTSQCSLNDWGSDPQHIADVSFEHPVASSRAVMR